ncbi:MAG: tyrosine-type recombinase/integrase [Raineya sp.]|jgi:integrase|nr:tyrosine-type recombinase/integrase [Raineya sp.]
MLLVSFASVLREIKIPENMILSDEGNENNILNYPYKLVRLVEGERPYLVFYVWDESKEKLVRIRKEIPKNINQKKWITETTKSINECLIAGCRLKKETIINSQRSPKTYLITEAFEFIITIRTQELALNSVTRAKNYLISLKRFLEFAKLEKLTIQELHKKHIIAYLDYLKSERKVANITRNNHLSWLKAVLNNLQIREFITENPAKGIQNLKEEETKSTAFEKEHIKLLANALKEESTETYIFCMFVFYTFIRPIELRRLQVSQVNLTTNKIQIFGSQSKNKKTEFVMIPEPLKEILTEYKFLERSKDDFLFSDHKDLGYSKNKYSTLFAKISKKLQMPKAYTLYCWKHTGVVEYYLAGCGLKFIQMQCRHASLDETNKYLKSLGLFENEEILRNAPRI